MKLLFLIKSLAAQGGGAERVLAAIAGSIASSGHDVVIGSFDATDATPFYPLDPRVRWVKLAVGDVDRSASPSETLRRIGALRAFVRKERPHVAIGFMHSVYVPLGWALAGTGVPALASEHIGFHYYRDRPMDKLLLRLSKPFLKRTTVISEDILRSFPAHLRRRTEVIPNPVDVTATASPRAPLPAEARQKILCVGRLEEQKDHKTLIAAFARIARDFPQWDLRIVGEGRLRPSLEQQIADEGLGDRVELPGATAAIGEEYARASLFVIPSVFESFGLVTAEALASGLPAIGFADCPGTNELIIDGVNGLLVSGADRVRELAGAMANLMADPNKRASLGAAGPQSVERFSLVSVTEKWLGLLGQVARTA